jgi:hypothetical protein
METEGSLQYSQDCILSQFYFNIILSFTPTFPKWSFFQIIRIKFCMHLSFAHLCYTF